MVRGHVRLSEGFGLQAVKGTHGLGKVCLVGRQRLGDLVDGLVIHPLMREQHIVDLDDVRGLFDTRHLGVGFEDNLRRRHDLVETCLRRRAGVHIEIDKAAATAELRVHLAAGTRAKADPGNVGFAFAEGEDAFCKA